jgi:glycosyltransferase involved in cell wall biosynthesis
MKIVFFIENLGSGGKERRMLELVQYLKINTNFKLYIVLLKDKIHYEYIYKWNIPITVMERKGMRKDPKIFWNFYKYCRKIQPDIIHAWSYINTFYAIPAKLMLNIPLVSSMVTKAAIIYKPWTFGMFIVKASCLFSDYILSNSQAGINVFRLTPEKSRVIYNGFHFERFEKTYDPESVRNQFNINSPHIVLMLASYHRFKNYDLFVEVANEVSKIRNDIIFVSAGGGPDLDRIKQLVRAKKVENIKLLGLQKKVESLIMASDIGVLFSNMNEGISNAIMEFMALKKPVIATDSPGNDEIVEDSKTGYLVSNDNLKEICDKIIYLVDHPEIREKMGQNGREKIENNFTIERMGKEFLQVYSMFANETEPTERSDVNK